jgi:hypothetical protein
MTWMSIFESMSSKAAAILMMGVDTQASKIPPTNVLGTAPGNILWSYSITTNFRKKEDLQINSTTHVLKGVWANAIHQDIVNSVQIETLLDLGIRCEEYVTPCRCEQSQVLNEAHARLMVLWGIYVSKLYWANVAAAARVRLSRSTPEDNPPLPLLLDRARHSSRTRSAFISRRPCRSNNSRYRSRSLRSLYC